MFRKIAAGTSAAVVAAGLATAPAVAAGLPVPAGDCADVAPTETAGVDQPTNDGFVFRPLAEVPHLSMRDRSCVVVAAPAPDVSTAHRRSSGSPPVKTPAPDVPTDVLPPDTSNPVDSGPPPAAPPVAAPAPPEAPPAEMPPPAPAETAPPARAPQEYGAEANNVLPEARPRSPRLPQTAADTRPLTAAGGGSLIAAGLAWIGGARRRNRRRLAD